MKTEIVTIIDNIKVVDKPSSGFYGWYIKQKVYKRSSFLGIKFWQCMETNLYGPYKHYLDVLNALEEKINNNGKNCA